MVSLEKNKPNLDNFVADKMSFDGNEKISNFKAMPNEGEVFVWEMNASVMYFPQYKNMKYLKFINNFFAKHLLACNTVSSAVIMTSGDIIIQKITSPDKHELDRTYKMGFVGALMGPLEHLFYKNLDIVFPKNDKRTVFKKILADQTLAAPFFICSFFFFCNAWEKKPKESIDEIKAKFLDVYKVDLLIWPVAQYINFVYLPPQLRVLYVSGISVIYTAFLSYIKHQ